MNNKYVFIFFVIVLVILCLVTYKLKEAHDTIAKQKESNNLIEASMDSLKLVYNEKTKEWQSERKIFKANNEELDKYLKEKEKELYKLRNDYNSVIGIISKNEFKADTVVINDPVAVIELDTTVRVANIKTPYYNANIKSYADSTKLNISGIYNEQKFSIDKSGKLIIINSNPYIIQHEGKGFYITQPEQKTKNWKYYIGIAGGLTLGYFTFK